MSLWGLAVVCEDYFVPSITIMCERNKIPDDVAGATFMAAGASSPEMFACFVSLFITHTALGAGTIIGSEIFNHLCITAAAVLYSKGGELQLDWRLVMRESLFYLLALLMLLGALVFNSKDEMGSFGRTCKADTHDFFKTANIKCNNTEEHLLPHDTDDEKAWKNPPFTDKYCIFWWQPLCLVLGYVAYALTCAYYQNIMQMFCPGSPAASELETSKSTEMRGPADSDSMADSSIHMPKRVRATTISTSVASHYAREPSQNFQHKPKVSGQTGHDSLDLQVAAFAPSHMKGHFLWNVFQYEDLSIENGDNQDAFLCYLWKRSRFYHVRSLSHNAWKLRWFQIDGNGIVSRKSSTNLTKERIFKVGSTSTVEVVDEHRFLFNINDPEGTHYVFHAPSKEIMEKFIKKTEEYIQKCHSNKKPDHTNPLLSGDEDQQTHSESQHSIHEHEEPDHELLIEWPEGGGILAVMAHCILIIPKYLTFYSVPDVRMPPGEVGEKKYPQAILMCFIWLVAWSYIMAECLDKLGTLVGISELVMGMTVSAVGTSFPNVFASMIVAKQGLGNMACSNALGGNVFNVFMGLGFPWLCMTLFASSVTVDTNSHMYFGMTYGGTGNSVRFPVIVLIALITGHIIILLCTGFKLYKIHAYIFITIYVGFLIWVLVYNTESPIAG